MENKNKANSISIEQAKEDYGELIEEAINNRLWFKAKGLNLWLSPYELQDGWEFQKYLFPIKYWHLKNPNDYLRPHSKHLQKAQNMYEYAHKRYQAYAKRLDQNTPINIENGIK
jgi:hypothetical protein